MHASLYYEYGMMLCINTPAPELRDGIRAGRTRKVGRSDDGKVAESAEEKRREHVGSERRGWRRSDGTGRPKGDKEAKE